MLHLFSNLGEAKKKKKAKLNFLQPKFYIHFNKGLTVNAKSRESNKIQVLGGKNKKKLTNKD